MRIGIEPSYRIIKYKRLNIDFGPDFGFGVLGENELYKAEQIKNNRLKDRIFVFSIGLTINLSLEKFILNRIGIFSNINPEYYFGRVANREDTSVPFENENIMSIQIKLGINYYIK